MRNSLLAIGVALTISTFALQTQATAQPAATTPFAVPRSAVVELRDPTGERIYPLFIKLPKSYAENSRRKYPVIYLTDAPYAFQIISGSTRYPMGSGKMKEAIIVGISYSREINGAASRIRDYTPSHDPSWKRLTGKASDHAAFIEKTVFPYIENNYRTTAFDRTFVGNSLGGLFGAYILLTKPDMFDNYILGSPSVWFKDDFILSLNPVPSNRKKKVFISVGDRETPATENTIHDMVDGARRLYAKLNSNKENALNTKLLLIPEATHESAFPTTAIQGLEWIYSEK